MRSRDTRLAVMFATAPDEKTRRALAMSTNDVRIGTPTACTWSTCSPTSVRIRSMSWIIRSSTTATSAPRGLNGASRSLSMKRGRSTYASAPRIARLNRSTCPVWISAPVRSAIARSSSASASVRRQRLLDEQVTAALEGGARHLVVRRRRDHDRQRLALLDQ